MRHTGEQRHETDRYDRADLGGSPGQLGEAAKPRVPRGVGGVAGPDGVTGVGIVVRPAKAPRGRGARGIRRPAGNRRAVLVGVVRQPIGRTALQGSAACRGAVGVARVGILRHPVGRAGPWRTGRFRRLLRELVQVVAGPVREPGRSTGRGNGRLAGVGGVVRPLRAAGLPGPVVCRWFIAVTHTGSTAQNLLRAPEEVFNKLLEQKSSAIRYRGPGWQMRYGPPRRPREADYGHVAGKIIATADELDARMIVVGSRTATAGFGSPCPQPDGLPGSIRNPRLHRRWDVERGWRDLCLSQRPWVTGSSWK